MFRLRPAFAIDAGQIRAFIRQENLNPFGLDWRRFTVAEAENGRLVGCVQYKTHSPDIIELASLVVHSDWRGKGVGKALVKQLQDTHGPPLWLMCAGATAAYYRPLGFGSVIDPKAMPPYFRRLFRISTLFRRFLRPENRLTIMVWPPPGPAEPA
jgi:N-acetylglutamate synthase-like GNAT family acetyltransferase